ncbi:hypothetical protein [Pseudomonas sp. Leaf58]|uniref:hypothetical protein n=1 Tax=Pseudomonas sp. Leaf58 TaxID=1736226 RepID=UPI0006F3B988|nr:hypothetical protein [Pseudomonas sp. Leaf58]KQN62496.1 hypothetical protein ASF02_10120 [Pseudomonas sp. Leaf58]
MNSIDDVACALRHLDNLILRSPLSAVEVRRDGIAQFRDSVLTNDWIDEAVATLAFKNILAFKYNYHTLFRMKDGFPLFREYQDMLLDLGVRLERAVVSVLSGKPMDGQAVPAEQAVGLYLDRIPASLKQRSWRELHQAWCGTLLMRHDLSSLDPSPFNDATLLKLYKLTREPRFVQHMQSDLVVEALALDLGL